MEGPASPMDTNVDDPPTPTMDDHDDGPQSPTESSMQDGPQSPTGPASPDMDMGPASPTQPDSSQSPAQPRSPDTSAVADTSETVASPSQDAVASPPQSPVKESTEQDIPDKNNDEGAMGDKEEPNKEAAQSKVSSNNLDLAKVHDDHVELDFDEELEEIEEKEKSTGERVLDKGKEEGETAKDEAEQDDGQLSVSQPASWIPATAGFSKCKKWTQRIKKIGKSGLSGEKVIKVVVPSTKCEVLIKV